MTNLNDVYLANPVTELAAADLLYLLDDPGGTPAHGAITKADLFLQILKELEYGSKIVWDSATGYHVEPGRRIVNGSSLAWAANITRSALSLSVSTLYYVYLYDNGGTPAVEESATVPVWNSTYRYWQKTGDATRRCVGYLVTDGSGNIKKFTTVLSGNTVEYILADGDSVNRRVVNSGGVTAAWTSFDVSAYVPLHGTHSYLLAKVSSITSGDDGILGISPIDLGAGVAANGAAFHVRSKLNAVNAVVMFGGVFHQIFTTQTHYYRLQDVVGTDTVAIVECGGCRFEI